NELLRLLKLRSAQFLLKGWRGADRARASAPRDLFTNELLKRGCGPSLVSLKSFAAARRDGRQVVVVDGFTNESLGRGCGLTLDSLQSLMGGIGLRLQAALLVVVGRLLNEGLTRGCIGVVLYIGSRKRALENAGWR